MDEREFSRIIRNPRHISGVHNYCDRWCQRCPFTLRCSVYAVEEVTQIDAPAHDKEKETLWPRLEAHEIAVRDLIAANAEHPGVGQTEAPKFGAVSLPGDSHRAGAAAKRYVEFANKFLDQHEKDLPKRTELGAIGVSAAEAYEVVAWYHLFIMIKLSRAMPDDEFEDVDMDDPELADMPRDEDGSAKIALIGVDRSILAWYVISQHEPSLSETAYSAIMTLHRMRVAVEKEFPKARAFVRPGFDTHRFPDKKI